MYCVVRGTLEIWEMPCKRVSLYIGALLWNMEGVLLPVFLREKKEYIWVQ
jgi:hypothetical protein